MCAQQGKCESPALPLNQLAKAESECLGHLCLTIAEARNQNWNEPTSDPSETKLDDLALVFRAAVVYMTVGSCT